MAHQCLCVSIVYQKTGVDSKLRLSYRNVASSACIALSQHAKDVGIPKISPCSDVYRYRKEILQSCDTSNAPRFSRVTDPKVRTCFWLNTKLQFNTTSASDTATVRKRPSGASNTRSWAFSGLHGRIKDRASSSSGCAALGELSLLHYFSKQRGGTGKSAFRCAPSYTSHSVEEPPMSSHGGLAIGCPSERDRYHVYRRTLAPCNTKMASFDESACMLTVYRSLKPG